MKKTPGHNPSQPQSLGRDPRTPPPGPHIDPRVSDPKALDYAASIQARRGTQLPKYTTPVAGGATPAIPSLDTNEFEKGMTIQQHAERERAVAQAQQAAMATAGMGGIIDPSPMPALGGAKASGAGAPTVVPGLRLADVLPEEAKKDPLFQSGMGSLSAVNQPHLALKYGVIRNGVRIAPQALNQPSPNSKAPKSQLRPETIEDMKRLEALQSESTFQQVASNAADAKVEREAQSGIAGQAAGTTEKKMSQEEAKDLLDKLDDFDLHRFKNAVMKDLLNNDEQKDLIESRLTPLDLTDMITTGRVTQIVPIVPGTFEPEFQSLNGNEDLTLKRMLTADAKSLSASDRYFMDKYSIMGLTIALISVNKRPLPSCYDVDGNIDDEKFWEKFDMVSKLDYNMLSSLIVNWFWFDVRVRKLFVAEKLGNG